MSCLLKPMYSVITLSMWVRDVYFFLEIFAHPLSQVRHLTLLQKSHGALLQLTLKFSGFLFFRKMIYKMLPNKHLTPSDPILYPPLFWYHSSFIYLVYIFTIRIHISENEIIWRFYSWISLKQFMYSVCLSTKCRI